MIIKKNIPKKSFCYICVCALLISVFLSSCSQPDAAEDTPDPSTSEAITEASSEPVKELTDKVPELDFKGYEITILGNAPLSTMNSILEAEETGEPIDDACYRRSMEIQERLNCKIKEVQIAADKRAATFKTDVLSGDPQYDIAMMDQTQAFTMVQNSLIYNINDLKHVDLDAPWYGQNARKSYSIANKVFFVPGAYELTNFDLTRIIMFNQRMMRDNGITDNLYDLVREGKWTFDKFFSLAKTVSEDVNGDGKYTVEDKYGAATTAHHVMLGSFMAGAGELYVSKDENDLPYFSAGLDRFNTVFNTLVDNFYTGNFYFNGEWYTGGNADEPLNNMFMEDRLLFYVISVNRIPKLRSMENDFGILPLPKFDETQEEYHCESGNGMVAVIPQNIQEPDRSGAFLELYSYYGYKYVVPAYKEVTLKTKHTRDEESMEMMDIIDVSRFYDIGRLYWADYISNKYRDAFANKSTSIASVTEKIQGPAEVQIAKGIEVFSN